MRNASKPTIDSTGIQEDQEISSFLVFQLILGERSYEDAALQWVQRIFRVRNISGSEKMSRMQAQHPL